MPDLAESDGRLPSPPRMAGGSAGIVRYLSVGLGERRLAIPLDRVIGVVESAIVTAIPFSPPPFDGLVQAMGLVIPQISLAGLLGYPPNEGGILVVVSDVGGSVALRVDQVHAMFQLDREKLVLAGPEQRAAQPMVLGTFDDAPNSYAILSLDHLTSGALSETVAEIGSVLLAPETPQVAPSDEALERPVEPYLMIGVSGFIYAVRITQVLELIELSSLRPVPHRPAWVAGMIDLRGEPILGLSLAELLMQPESAAGRIGVAVALDPGCVVLIAERSLGIERYADDQVHAMREPVAGISSYLVRPDGSITGVIDPASLLRPIEATLRDWAPQTARAADADRPAQSVNYRQLLTLRAGREMVAVALERIHRLQASVQVTPIPARDTGFDGLADVGDAVVPVLDLRRILSADQAPRTLPTLAPSAMPPCLLTMIEGSMAGLIVDQVLRIETVSDDQLSPAEQAPNLPISEILNLNGRLLPVVSLERLLPQL